RIDRRTRVSGHQPELPAAEIGEEGDPAHIHHHAHTEHFAVLRHSGGKVLDGQDGDDAFDVHLSTRPRPPAGVHSWRRRAPLAVSGYSRGTWNEFPSRPTPQHRPSCRRSTRTGE